ncbi:hypothetical protein [Conexibacter woesei]|uniref:hypothetical protein n=1 Tax=Conexibacter woesei TaxID=191495 RepID=UPI00040E5988|nr:hypothetical protein [Conexibacter woesei]
MQIALVAVVLLAGMWFTVLKPKSADTSSSAPVAQATTQSSEPVAPGVKGLTSAIDKAKGAAATSDAANAKIQTATGGNAATASTSAPASTASATATATAAAKRTTVTKKPATATATRKPGTKAATAKAVAAKPAATKTVTKPATTAPAAKTTTPAKTTAAAKPAVAVDPSARLLAYLAKGKTLVILFYGRGADDKAARKAVHQTAQGDPKHVVSAYVPISKVGQYEAITSDVDVLAAPTILVISTKGKATPLTGYVDAAVVRNAVSAARTAAASGK